MESATPRRIFRKVLHSLLSGRSIYVIVVCSAFLLFSMGLLLLANKPFGLYRWFLIVLCGLLLIILSFLLSKYIAKHIRIKKIINELKSTSTGLNIDDSQKILKGLENLTHEKYRHTIRVEKPIQIKETLIRNIRLSVTIENTKIEDCHLADSEFGNQSNFKFTQVHFTRNNLNAISFSNGDFTHVYFNTTRLLNCIFTKISFFDTQFDHVKMWNVQFKQCVFHNPIQLNIKNKSIEGIKLIVSCGFICSKLEEVCFDNVHFNGIDFTGTSLLNCKFINVSGLQPKDFFFVKTLFQTELPEEIDCSLRKSHPQLFIEPTGKYRYSNPHTM